MRSILTWSLALAALILAVPRPATAQTSEVLDPIGDASNIFTAQPFQDIVSVVVSKRGGVFRFVMEVADRIPANPPPIPGVNFMEWSFRLDTDPTTFPAGFPFAPGAAPGAADFIVFVLWDGIRFTAFVIDRRPLLTGGEAVIIPVPLDIRLREITVSVDPGIIGDPPNFLWRTQTEDWSAHLGTNSFMPLDQAPNNFVFASWPPQ